MLLVTYTNFKFFKANRKLLEILRNQRQIINIQKKYTEKQNGIIDDLLKKIEGKSNENS